MVRACPYCGAELTGRYWYCRTCSVAFRICPPPEDREATQQNNLLLEGFCHPGEESRYLHDGALTATTIKDVLG